MTRPASASKTLFATLGLGTRQEQRQFYGAISQKVLHSLVRRLPKPEWMENSGRVTLVTQDPTTVGAVTCDSRGSCQRRNSVLMHDKEVTMEQFGQRILTGMVVARMQLESRLEEAVNAGARMFQKRKAAESPSVTKADQRCRGCAAHAALPTARPQKGANSCPLTTTSSYLSQTSSFSLSFPLVLSPIAPIPLR